MAANDFTKRYLALRKTASVETESRSTAKSTKESKTAEKAADIPSNNGDTFTGRYLALREARKQGAQDVAERDVSGSKSLPIGTGANLYSAALDRTARKAPASTAAPDAVTGAATKRSESLAKGSFTGSRKTAEERPDWGTIAGGTALGGLQQFTKGLSATAAMLEKPVAQAAGWVLGNDQLYQDAPFYRINQNMDKEIAAHQARLEPEYEKAGTAGKAIEKFGVPAVAAVPQAVTAFLTFGQSLAAQGSTAGLTAASAAAQSTGAAKIAGMVADGLKNTAANPQFWLSFLSTAGPEYEQAKADGADEAKAYAYAALSGALNSLVEVGGGIDNLPDISKSALKEWAGSMIDEGKEEVVQGVISQALQRGMYGKNNPLASLTDENAIFSLRRGFDELAGGAVVGGILGGAQIGVQRALTGPQKTFSDAVQEQIMGNQPRSAAESAPQVQAPQAQKNAAQGAVRADTSVFDRSLLQNFNQARKYFIDFAKRSFPSSVVNRETGKTIGISRTGLDKFLSGNIPYEKYASGFHIPELIETARKVGEAGNYHGGERAGSVPTFEYYDSGVEIDGQQYTAHIRVKNTLNGDRYYGHTVSEVDDIKIEPPTRTPSSQENQTVQPENTGGSMGGDSSILDDAGEKILFPAEPSARTSVPNGNSAVQPVNAVDGSVLSVPQNGGNVNPPGAEISDRAAARLSRADRRTLQNLAKITGSNIQFIPRAQLEQMAGAGAEGMQRNGQIYISEDAQRPYMEIARHEITHRLQQTAPEQYAAFRDYVADLYRETGDLDAYLQGIQENRARAGLEISKDGALDEIAADYAADLLEDEKAVRKLAGDAPGLLTRLLDALRDFIAKAKTALGGKGNAQTAELEQGAALWQAALEESAKNSGAEGDGKARYSIAYDRDNRPFVTVEEDILAGVDRKDWARAVKENLKRKFPNGVTVGNNQIQIDRQSIREITYSRDTKRLSQDNPTAYADKLRSTNNADEILQASRNYVNEGLNHNRKDNIKEFARGTVQLRIGGNDYTADVIVGTRRNGNMILYDVINLTPTSIQEKIKKSDAAIAVDPSPGTDRSTAPNFTGILPQSSPSVKFPQTFSEEIARQLGGHDTDQRLSTQEDAALKRQVDALRRQNQRLREQMKRTTGAEMDEKSVRKLSRALLKDYNSSYAAEDLSSRVGALYKKIAEQTVSETDARAEARAIAGDILDGSQTELNPLYEEYSELRRELRTRGISVAPEYRADLDGGYSETRKRMMGTLKLTENGAAVDQVYDDLSQRYPELFPEDIYNPADQINRIIDVAGELQSVMGSTFEGAEMDRAADFLAGDILERFYDTPERAPTFADRQTKKLEAERQRGRDALERQKAMFEGRSEREMEKLRRLREGQLWDQRKQFEKDRARDRKAYQEAFERQKELLKKRDEKIAALQERRKAEQAKRQDSVERDKLLNIARRLNHIKTTDANRKVIDSLISDLDLVAKSMSGKTIKEITDEVGTVERLTLDQDTRDKIARFDKTHINDMDIKDVRDLTNLLLYAEKEMRKRGEILTPKADSEERSKLLRVARRLDALKTTDATREKINSYISDLDLVSKSITGKTVTKLTELKAWYEDQKANNSDFLSDEAIEKKLARLEKKKIDDMDLADVRDLTDTLLNIENELRTQRKLLGDEDRRDTYRLGQEAAEHIRASKGGARGGAGAALDRYIITETLSPERYVRRLTGYADADPLAARTRDLSKGQRAMLDYKRRAWRLFQTFVDDRGFLSRLTGKKAEAVEVTGLGADGPATVQITPDMRVSLYLHSLSDDNLRHIAQGGITVPDMALYRKGDLAEAYARGTTIKLTPSQVRSITSRMTPQELEYANAISRGYFNGMSRQEINQTSEMLKGYSLAKEENYFPIDTDSRFLRQDQPEVKRDGSIEGMGFTKERITNASSPIYLRDASSVLTRAIDQHAMYVGLAIPVRNFHKVYSVTMSGADAKGDHLAYTGSVKQALENKWGSAATGYIDKMLRDLQPGGRGDAGKWGSFFNKIRSNYAGAVLTLNASVAMKQAASYPTAAAVLGWKPLAKAMGDFGKVDLETINKYTPLLWYRSLGFDGAELGDVSAGNTSMPKALNWIQGIDVMTTRKLWKASEYYVQDHNRSLRKGSGAYYRAVADIYNRVIEETQPNYTAMQRPQLLRSENEFLKTISMFKTQPFQNANILYDAAANYQAKRAQNHRNSTETSRQALRDARRDLGNAVSSQVASVAVFAGMTALWNLFRHREDKYADEDTGEVTAASFFRRFFKDMLSSAAGQVPFGGEAYSAAAGLADKIAGQLEDMEKGRRLANGLRWIGDDYYGMESVTTQALTDAVTAIMKTGDAVGETITAVNDEGPKRNAWLSWTDMAEDVSKLFGIPVENILNVGRASVQWVMQAAYGEALGDYYALAMTTKTSKKAPYYDSLWSAYGKDWDAARTIYKDMLELGFDEDGISDAMEDRMAKALGLGKASSLPVEYSAPGSGGSFDQEVRRQLERGGGWKDALPKDSGNLAKTLDGLEPEEGMDNVTKRQRIKEIGDSPFSDEAKELSVKRLLGEKELERFQAAKKAGISVGAWCRLYVDIANAREVRTGKTGTASKQDVALALDSVSLTDKQKDAVWESYGWESDWQNSIAGKDLSVSTRKKVTGILNALKPKSGEKDVTDQQKQEAIAKSSLSEKDKLGALETVMGEGERKKLNAAYNQGVSPVDYVAAKAKMVEYDENENDSVSQDEAKKALKAMDGLTNEEKAALWQIQNKTWKPENNPFDRKTAKAVYAALNPEEDE